MNRMLYLRDLDVDVLIRCRACGHEGVLPHAEAMRRFGASYPVLSIAPHYRCSACNARDAESLAAPAPEPLYATPVDHHGEHEDDGGFAAALASLQNLVEAAHGQSAAPKRKAAPEPEPEPEVPPPPINAAWDDEEEAAARAAWDAEPVWSPPQPAPPEEQSDEAPAPRRRRDTPALPDKPFFASRERVRRAPPVEPPPVAAFTDDDDNDFEREEHKRAPADAPLSSAPVLSLADIKALLGSDDDEPAADETADAPVDEATAEAFLDSDDDDPLLSSALQRLLRNAPAETVEDEDVAAAVVDAADFAAVAAAADLAEDEEELSDEELISFAIGDRDAASGAAVSGADHDALPPEMAALLADDDEDEVYEYAPGEIIDQPPQAESPAEIPDVSSDSDIADIDIAEIVDFARPADLDAEIDQTAEIPPLGDADVELDPDEEPLLLEDATLAPVVGAAAFDREDDEEEDPDLAALRALLAETENRDQSDDENLDDLDVGDTERAVAGFERPPRDTLIDDGDDGAEEPPPAWRTQRPPPAADSDGEEGMEDALATLRALIEQAAAEPEEEESAGAPPAYFDPVREEAAELAADRDSADEPPPAFAARIDDDDEDDPEAWAALMREVAAKAAGEDRDDTLPLAAAPLAAAPLAAAPASPAPPSPVAASPAVALAEEKAAAKRGGSLDDTLTRLRGLLDLPPDEPPRSRGRRR